MKKQYQKIRWFSFAIFAALLVLFGFIYYLICANLFGGGILSVEGEGFGAAVGSAAATFLNLMTGIGGMIAAPVVGIVAIPFGARASRSRFGAIRWIARILLIALVIAIVALIVIFFALKQ